MEIKLTNGEKEKICKIGFSWTTLFFRWWVPLLRGDWLWFLIMLVVTPQVLDEGWRGTGLELRLYASENSWSGMSFTIGGILAILMAVMYNRIYIRGLLKKGYVTNIEDRETLIEKEFIDCEGEIKPLFRKLNKEELKIIAVIFGILFLFIMFNLIAHIFAGDANFRMEFIRLPIVEEARFYY